MSDEFGGGGSQREAIAHDLPEIRRDIHEELETLDESIAHDYSTSDTGIVPLSKRRPMWHFAGLWMTFSAGFSFVFVGTAVHDGGHSFASTLGILAIGIGVYLAYAMVGAYVGSRTGQTHALLTRSIFGVSGSSLVSVFAFCGALGFVGFQANLLAQIWDGLYGWGHVELLTILLAALMIFNNLFGFTGISAYARYLVTPLLVLWIYYLIVKGVAVDHGKLSAHVHGGGLGYWPSIGVVIGFCMWGNEPDVWRYGKPSFSWPLPSYVFGLVFGLGACGVAGWMMAEFSGTTDFAALIRYMTHYSLFGVFVLAFILATISQVAINDGNYYETINALQNLVGGWRHWRRLYTCLVCSAGGALAAYLVNYVVVNGFTTVSAFLAITVPCATVIMAVDHFVLPRAFQISRPLLKVPAWRDAAFANWPAVAALVGSVVFGAFATGIMPGASKSRYWGVAPAESWALAGILYFVFVAIARAATSDVRGVLGFTRHALEQPAQAGEVVDIASQREQDRLPIDDAAPAILART